MYLSRLKLNRSRAAVLWLANPYRVHQRIKLACEGDPRVLFRVEERPEGNTQILVQSHTRPNWDAAFADLAVLLESPEFKPFNPRLTANHQYRFRLLANPTVCKATDEKKASGKRKQQRLGLLRQDDQRAWLARKLNEAGAELLGCVATSHRLQRSHKSLPRDAGEGQRGGGKQTHLAVLFEGVLLVNEPDQLVAALENGIGPAKGYGFGLLSLAPV